MRTEADACLRRDLRYVYGDGVTYSLMLGLGETYVPAFALAIGMSEVAAGWIVAIPMLAGALLQLVSPLAVRRLRSHKRWVVICASLQAASFLGFFIAAVAGRIPDALLFLIAALYWGTNLGAGPAWNTWVETLVPRTIRARYFAVRGRSCQAAALLGTVGAGLALHLGASIELTVFAVLFALAGLSRGASTWFLARQSEPYPMPHHQRDVRLADLIRRMRHGADGRLLVYLLALQTAVQIAGPFFTPYMLGELHFSYLRFLTIVATAFIAKMAAYPYMGNLARRWGSQKLLLVCGAGIVPLSALWIFSHNLVYLLCVQVVGGIIWSGYELAVFLLFFERIDHSERTSLLTLFNLTNAAALVGGALIGGLLLGALGSTAAAYHKIFGLSGIARILTLVLLMRLRVSGPLVSAASIPARTVALRPNTGALQHPLVGGMGGDEDAEID